MPAGIEESVPSETESLCSLVKSTTKGLGRMKFWALPLDGVSETPLIEAVMDRMLVPGGGVNGVACIVRLRVAPVGGGGGWVVENS